MHLNAPRSASQAGSPPAPDAKAPEAIITIATQHPTPPAGINSPTNLEDHRRRRGHLERLLNLRSQLALVSAERQAHGIDDAGLTYGQLLSVENAIREDFPQVYEERLPRWVESDARLEHDGRLLRHDCGVCRAIARHSRINLTPPEAA